MRLRVGVACGGAIFVAIAFLACFPEYKFSDQAGGNDGGGEANGDEAGLDGAGSADAHREGAMILIQAADASFAVSVSQTDGAAFVPRSELSHSFLLDSTEVTVGRFNAWVAADTPDPCGLGRACPLDPNGPYPFMAWDPAWNSDLKVANWTDQGCHDGDPIDSGIRGTFGGNPDFPITCVDWFQAVAFCAFEKKRLPTETEWRFAATSQARQNDFTFWSTIGAPGCDTLIYRKDDMHCGFPLPVGSAPHGNTDQGVYDLAGSVFEWHWDWYGEPFPSVSRDYAGPATGTDHLRPSGSYINASGDGALHSDSREHHPPFEYYSDAGFRCAKTVL